MVNPWVEWLNNHPFPTPSENMIRLYGIMEGKACKGCKFLVHTRHRSQIDGSYYTTLKCTRYPSWLNGTGNRWRTNFQACKLWIDKKLKGA